MITIQAGNYSNFVGAHLFNLQNPETQEQLKEAQPIKDNHLATTLWREVQNARNPQSRSTFTPRIIVFDTKENVASNDTSGVQSVSSQHKQNVSLWDGKVENLMDEDQSPPPKVNHVLGQQIPPQTNDYSRWVDFISWKLDSENVHLLPNFSHNPETGQLDSYHQGVEVWKSLEDKAENRMRKFAEECDRLEGFNILVDQLNGYGGLAGGLLQYLSDEYEKKVCIGIGLCPPALSSYSTSDTDAARDFRTRMINTTLLFDSFNSHSSMFTSLGLCQDFCARRIVPATLPYLKFKAESFYESSAILATTIDTLMSPCISTSPSSSSISLQELASFLTAMGRKMTSFSTSFPFPLDTTRSSFFGTLNSSGLDSLRGLTPGVSSNFETSNGNFFAIRGIPDNSVLRENERQGQMGQQTHITNAKSCLDLFVNESFSKAVNIVQSSKTPVIARNPFPHEMIEEFAKQNFKLDQAYSNGVLSSWSFGCISSAHNDTKCGGIIDQIIQNSTGPRYNRNKVTQTLPSTNELGIDVDDFVDSINNLESLKDAYNS